MRYALAAAAIVIGTATLSAREMGAEGDAMNAASAAARFAAIKSACPEAIPTDKIEADRFVDLYGEAGIKVVGVKTWARLIKSQTAQRIREIQVVGPQRWCEDQRRYVRELGDTKVFP